MTTIFRTIVLAAALASSAVAAQATPVGGDGLRMSCNAGQITPRGVWDCR